MKDVRYWFGWLIVVIVLHGVEQLLFGIDELYDLQSKLSAVAAMFPNRDYGIVLMVFAATILVMALVYGSLVGGRWRLLGPGFFGLSALGEVHHIVKTVARHAYFPGAVTAVPFVLVGVLLLRAVARELSRDGARS